MMLQVRDLSVSFGSLQILRDVSFDVEAGQWLMLIGPNGAGKTTVVNAVSQGVRYTGDVLFEGRDVKKMKSREMARCLGVLTQNHYVGYSFTVEEVIRLGKYSHRPGFFEGGRDASEELVRQAVEKTGMEPFLKQSVLTLSGGELQRAFLAQLFVQDPKLLILDEPTNHLDLVYQKQVFRLVKQWMQEKGGAVLSVVHDLSLARMFGTHALLLDKGRCVAGGTVQEVFDPQVLNAVYGMDVAEWMQTLLGQWEQ